MVEFYANNSSETPRLPDRRAGLPERRQGATRTVPSKDGSSPDYWSRKLNALDATIPRAWPDLFGAGSGARSRPPVSAVNVN